MKSFGYAGVSVVIIAIISAIFPLPALMMILGHRVDKFVVRKSGITPKADGRWAQTARYVMRKPVTVVMLSLIILAVIAAPNKIVSQGDVRYATRSSTSPNDWQYTTLDLGRRESPIAGFDVALRASGERLLAAWLGTSTTSPLKADRIRWMDLNNPSSLTEEKLNVAPKGPLTISDTSVIYGCEDRLCNFDFATKRSKLVSDESTAQTSSVTWITWRKNAYVLANISGKLTLLKRPDLLL